ncbi:cytochrome P450 [Rhodococcus jostii]|uniref:cytochrome P450 n=1 Tax=Rhodococcus jostii TaxID=132919 RepID=UPI00364A9D4D
MSSAIKPENLFAAAEPSLVRCPYPEYARLRTEQPVQWLTGLNAYAVTRYDDVLDILRRAKEFSSRRQTGPGSATPLAKRVANDESYSPEVRAWAARRVEIAESSPVLVNCDPPRHAQQRRNFQRTFSPARVEKTAPAIQAIADDLIDGFVARGSADIVRDFAIPLPMTVIADALGIPSSEMSTFKRWSDAFVMANGNPSLTREQIGGLFGAMNEFYDYMTAELAERDEAPRDDLITDVAAATAGEGEPLTHNERLQILAQFLIAGNETTTSLLAAAVLKFTQDPLLQDTLRKDPELVPAFVEEVLRLESPVQGLFRIANEDSVVGGTPVPKGSFLWLLYGSCNRDESVFPEADELQLERENATSHLAFARGEHLCLGANLARAEARIALQTLLRRLSRIRLAPGESGDEYFPSLVQHGMTRLKVVFEPA